MPVYNIQEHNAASLREIHREYGRLLVALDLAIRAIEEDGIESLPVRNNTWLDKGLQGTRKFIEAVREAHYDAKVSRGAYHKAEHFVELEDVTPARRKRPAKKTTRRGKK